MKNLQETIERGAIAELVEARVERGGKDLAVRLGAKLTTARVAPSCLLRPEIGDRVLVSSSATRATIIAVLERGEAEACIEVSDGTPIRLRGRGIELEASHIGIRASDAIRLEAGRTTIRARSLQLVADAVTTAAGAVRTVADRVDAIAERMTEYVGRSLRRVEREHVEAGDLTSRCSGVHETRGDAVVVVGRRVTKIDGGQIQVG